MIVALYVAFRNDPLFQRIFPEQWKILEFFRGIELLVQSKALKAICIRENLLTISVGVLGLGGRGSALGVLAALKHIIRSASLTMILEVFRWLGGSVNYWRALKRVHGYCHLLFLASMIQGRGYGSLILRAVESTCRRLGGGWLILDVDFENPALLFYWKRGFKPLGESWFSGRRYIIMCKNL
ncbi:MAG: GNAT family N-acetyltransferase [Infirmifilum sp.]